MRVSRTLQMLTFFALAACSGSSLSSANGASPAPAETTTSNASQTITMIGDSHSDYYGNPRGSFGFFGQHLTELLTKFNLFAASGSIPSWWLDSTAVQAAIWGYTQTSALPALTNCKSGSTPGSCVPKLSVILSIAPNLFIIEQGTNLLGYSNSFVSAQVKNILQEVQAQGVKNCLWVGAPNAATSVHTQASQDQLYQLLSTQVAPCYFYDSRFLPATDTQGNLILSAQGQPQMTVPLPYSPDANDDGEHLGMQTAGEWAQGVALVTQWLMSQH